MYNFQNVVKAMENFYEKVEYLRIHIRDVRLNRQTYRMACQNRCKEDDGLA